MESSTKSQTNMAGMVQAYNLAAISTHLSCQNGAVLYNEDGLREIGKAANTLLPGIVLTDARRADSDYYESAVVGAICEAARRGKSTQGSIMVCPWVTRPCDARALILAGIARLVVHSPRMMLTMQSQVDLASQGFDILAEAGVELVHLNTPVAGPDILVNGEPWSPDPVGMAGDFYRADLGQTYNPRREP
jgi:deoxycytidylate deaminase